MTGAPPVDEGYIKFECIHTPGPPPVEEFLAELDTVRRNMYRLGLVGHDEKNHVDFGNLSIRGPLSGQLIITGTQTGHRPALSPEHYSLVTACDIEANRVRCTGAVRASSETMTHAAIYALNPAIRAVIHVHHPAIWQRLKRTCPVTRPDVAYGTPDMADEIQRLYTATDLATRRLVVMGGHPAGLISFGSTPAEAEAPLLVELAE